MNEDPEAAAAALTPAFAALTPASATDVTENCFNCRGDDHLLYHIVCVRTNRGNHFRRYCTSCVLKTHRDSFCPTCFSLHSDPSSSANPQGPPIRTLACLKCKSYSHFSCVPSNAPKSPYLCPPCSTPNYKFFDIRKPSSNKIHKDGDAKSRKRQYIDLRLSKVLVLAAKIAANSLASAAKLAKQDADLKVKMASVSRKRAREGLEVVGDLWEKEKLLKQNNEVVEEIPMSARVRSNSVNRALLPDNRTEIVVRQQNGSVQQATENRGGVDGKEA